jgi:adenylate cyclase
MNDQDNVASTAIRSTGGADKVDLGELQGWLAEAGLKNLDADRILQGFCERAEAAGLTISRGHCSFGTVHPQVRAFAYTWERGKGIATTMAIEHAQEEREAWLRSPLRHMIDSREMFMRRRLAGPDAQLDFPVLKEFQENGATDWIGVAFPFGWDVAAGSADVSAGIITSWVTDADGGFSDAQLMALRRVLPSFALAIQSGATYAMAGAILGAYLGPDAGKRVLKGEIKRGDVQTLSAVLLLADLQGFTRQADVMPKSELGRMLDEYLERMVAPVHRHGGQVLKFLGDGLLATFDLGPQPDCATVCATALAAAEEMLAETRAFNESREKEGLPVMPLDVAVHMGDVLYGNFGSSDRLDFTVIGPAVNEVARIETLCQNLGSNLLISHTFASQADHCADRLVSLGRHALRGVREEQELFSLKSKPVSITTG